MEIVISNSESISNTGETVWVLGFHVISGIEREIGIEIGIERELKGKSTLQNVLYSTWKRNDICQTDENTVNGCGNVLVTSIKMAEE